MTNRRYPHRGAQAERSSPEIARPWRHLDRRRSRCNHPRASDPCNVGARWIESLSDFREDDQMNPSDEFRKFAGECRAMAKSHGPRRAKRHGTSWQRDGFGAPNSMKSIRRRQRVTGSQDIEGPSIAGPSATRLPEPSRYPTAPKSRRWGGVEDRGPRQILAFATSPWAAAFPWGLRRPAARTLFPLTAPLDCGRPFLHNADPS